MSITPEQLAAYADGELDEAMARRVEAEIEAAPALQAQLDRHQALKAKLTAHFAPIAEQPVPERLRRPLLDDTRAEKVVDISTARHAPRERRLPLRWAWLAGPALAAMLVFAVLGFGTRSSQPYAEGYLANALETQLVATQGREAPVHILLSFQNDDGQFCRGFSQPPHAGIACRDDRGWRIHTLLRGSPPQTGEYRQADSADAKVLAIAQDMAKGGALDSAREKEAVRERWQRPE